MQHGDLIFAQGHLSGNMMRTGKYKDLQSEIKKCWLNKAEEFTLSFIEARLKKHAVP